MKYLKALRFSFFPIFFLTTCHGVWNFYPDADDHGLSRFTSRGYNIASCYLNDTAYVNNGSFYPLLQKDSSASSIDTLQFKWPLLAHSTFDMFSRYHDIAFLLPIPQSFNKSNLLEFNGQRFLNSVPVTLTDTSQNKLSGVATLYFVTVTEALDRSNRKYIKMSGLFDGNIGDSISISKGRFDFEIYEGNLNF